MLWRCALARSGYANRETSCPQSSIADTRRPPNKSVICLGPCELCRCLKESTVDALRSRGKLRDLGRSLGLQDLCLHVHSTNPVEDFALFGRTHAMLLKQQNKLRSILEIKQLMLSEVPSSSAWYVSIRGNMVFDHETLYGEAREPVYSLRLRSYYLIMRLLDYEKETMNTSSTTAPPVSASAV